MLIEFKVSNFKSIREEQTLSLVASNYEKELPENVIDVPVKGLKGTKFLRGAALYGANASGKSNVLEALAFLASYVKNSATLKQPGEPTFVQPFKLDRESAKQPSRFAIQFVANGLRVHYEVAMDAKRIIEEALVAFPKGQPQEWYRRTWDAEKKAYAWEPKDSKIKIEKSLTDKTRENALFLSVAAQFNHAELTPVLDWFLSGIRFFDVTAAGIAPQTTEDLVRDDVGWRERVESMLRVADLGICGVRVVRADDAYDPFINGLERLMEEKGLIGRGVDREFLRRRLDKMQFAHTGTNQVVSWLDEHEESDGTMHFFETVGPWLRFIDTGGLLVVDEIETSLHPLLVKELIRMVFASGKNTAQLIFTTHNTAFLDHSLLRRDQIWFTEKDPSGATTLYPLSDFHTRKGEALSRGYLAGRYGAIPSVPEGLGDGEEAV